MLVDPAPDEPALTVERGLIQVRQPSQLLALHVLEDSLDDDLCYRVRTEQVQYLALEGLSGECVGSSGGGIQWVDHEVASLIVQRHRSSHGRTVLLRPPALTSFGADHAFHHPRHERNEGNIHRPGPGALEHTAVRLL